MNTQAMEKLLLNINRLTEILEASNARQLVLIDEIKMIKEQSKTMQNYLVLLHSNYNKIM